MIEQLLLVTLSRQKRLQFLFLRVGFGFAFRFRFRFRRNNIHGWHRIFWPNRSSITRSHTCQHHAEITQSHTFAALIRLSTTMHKLLTFNISEISSNSLEKLSLLPDFSLSLVLFKFPDVQSQGRRITLALFSHQKEKCLGPGQSSPEIFLSSEAKDLVVTLEKRTISYLSVSARIRVIDPFSSTKQGLPCGLD